MALKVLVACEESQAVCKAFRELGHEAYSCDIQECSGGHPEWHIMGDVLEILEPEAYYMPISEDAEEDLCIVFHTMDGHMHFVDWWDLIIAHPPCTDLAVSGARHFARKRADGSQQRSIDFFMRFTDLDCPHVAIENPICIMSTLYRKPDQIIQPYQFGHPIRKSTCLWLKGLPKLTPTDIVEQGDTDKYGFTIGGTLRYATDENGKIISWNDPRTAKIRSKTFPGIAKAMAEQWSEYIEGERKG